MRWRLSRRVSSSLRPERCSCRPLTSPRPPLTEIVAKVGAQWTFPLRFAEIVWGDGQTTHREVIPLADTRDFGGQTFEWRAPAAGWTWARVAVWDVAGNGAFVNPFWRP